MGDLSTKGIQGSGREGIRKVVASLIALPALMEKTKAFAANWKDKPRDELTFCPHPATWLNDARYDDEPDVKPAPTATRPPDLHRHQVAKDPDVCARKRVVSGLWTKTR